VKTPVQSAPISIGPPSRTIASAEVVGWFEKCRKPRPNESLCTEIAVRLTKMSWASDPPETFGLKNYDELRAKGMITLKRRDAESRWEAVIDKPDDRWWDMRGTASAANTLIENMPRMLRFWEGLRPLPNALKGRKAIKALAKSLSDAHPFIEWPFGKYERLDPRKQARPRSWHTPAVAIAHIVVTALMQSGHRSRITAADSITVKVVRGALIRMGYPQVEMSTIARYLERRAKKVGHFGQHRTSTT
jgi:hypothetical protein